MYYKRNASLLVYDCLKRVRRNTRTSMTTSSQRQTLPRLCLYAGTTSATLSLRRDIADPVPLVCRMAPRIKHVSLTVRTNRIRSQILRCYQSAVSGRPGEPDPVVASYRLGQRPGRGLPIFGGNLSLIAGAQVGHNCQDIFTMRVL